MCITGGSGVGKSTLLRIFVGLLTPTEGKRIRAPELSQPHVDAAIMFQEPRLLPWRTALGNIEIGMMTQHLSRRDRQERSKELLDLVNLGNKGGSYPYQLSGGQQQRVALARALSTGARALVLDEPFSSLDYTLRAELRELVSELLTKHKVSLLIVSHDPGEAKALDAKELTIESLYRTGNFGDPHWLTSALNRQGQISNRR